MTSKLLRTSSKLLRNEYPVTASGFPILKLVDIPTIDCMLSFRDTRTQDPRALSEECLVHFFKDDDQFDRFYDKPEDTHVVSVLKKFAQYSAVCTPDFSLYPEMPRPVQEMQVFRNRWCGAHWQDLGLCVVPTVTWGDKSSFKFCFDGIPSNSVVAISTLGCQKFKTPFLDGYYAMREVLQPQLVYCYGTPFEEIAEDVTSFPYEAFRRDGVVNG